MVLVLIRLICVGIVLLRRRKIALLSVPIRRRVAGRRREDDAAMLGLGARQGRRRWYGNT
jgi:hypothetical protein